jgi:hypothetical protein
LGSLMEVSRSHIFANWFSRSIKYMSPEISTTVPTPFGMSTLSLRAGLQTLMDFSLAGGNALACLTGFRNELNPLRSFDIVLLLSRSWPVAWLGSQWSFQPLQSRKQLLWGYQKRRKDIHAFDQLRWNLIPGALEHFCFYHYRLKEPECQSR